MRFSIVLTLLPQFTGIPWIGNKLCLFLPSEAVVAQFRYGLHFPGSKLIQKVKILKDPCFIPCFVVSKLHFLKVFRGTLAEKKNATVALLWPVI